MPDDKLWEQLFEKLDRIESKLQRDEALAVALDALDEIETADWRRTRAINLIAIAKLAKAKIKKLGFEI